MTETAEAVATVTVAGVELEVLERGQGRPLVFLHAETGPASTPPIADLVSARAHLVAPTHPGYGALPRPDWLQTVDDLAYLYLDLLDRLSLRDTILVGASLGGWIAAEMAIKSTARIAHLVLLNPVGIKPGARESRDIVDIYALMPGEYEALAYHDPNAGKHDYRNAPETATIAAARAMEATARYAWSPYMHDPKLKGRLHRIHVPTLILWGASDRLADASYGRAYADAIPGARFEPVPQAGHFPHVEQPDEVARRMFEFVGGI